MRAKAPLDVSGYSDLQLCLKALDVGVWDYDLDRDVLACDARWYAIVGIAAGTIGCVADFRRFIHLDDAEYATSVDVQSITEMIETDQRYHVDFRIVRPDGAVRWLRSVACLLVDPSTGHRRAIGCVSDNTEFRRIEAGIGDPTPNVRESDDAPEDGSAEGLTAKELECLSWVSVGKTAWETAMILDRSPRTVEFHLANAVRKLAATNKIHAAVIAVRRRLI